MIKISHERCKKSAIEWKLTSEDYNYCLEATQLKNKINKLDKLEKKVVSIKKS